MVVVVVVVVVGVVAGLSLVTVVATLVTSLGSIEIQGDGPTKRMQSASPGELP